MVTDLWRAPRHLAGRPDAARRGRRARLLRRGLRRCRRALHRRRTRSGRDACRAGARRGTRDRSSAPRGWRCRSPTPASTSACRPTSPSTCRQPWRLGREMLRVTQARRAGGAVVHGVARPVRRARDGPVALPGRGPRGRALRPQARPPAKNDYGSSLFAVSAADGLEWAASTGALIAAFPRYHPRWAWWMTRVPVLEGVPGEQSGAGPAAALTSNWNRFSFRSIWVM